MTGARTSTSPRCPDCATVLSGPDPLVGWWLCDDCECAVDADGARIA